MKLEFPQKIFENTQISNFTKILSVGAELFHAERRRTDTPDEANSRFSQFCEHA